MQKTIGLCLIGAGRAGMIHARNFAARVPNARMVAVQDVDENAAKAAAVELNAPHVYTDYRQALQNSEVDAVIVVTPTKFHRNIVVDAANAKKHIFCEKPMAMDVHECKEMIKAAEHNNVKLQIGFMRRFDKGFRRAKEIIAAGAIGDVVLVKSLTRGPSTPRPWMYDIEISNGPLAEVNSHDIDTVRWLTGGEVGAVQAFAGNFRSEEARGNYPDFYDTVVMNLKMQNGTLGNIDGAQGVQYGYDARVDILGTKGSIQVGQLQNTATVAYTPSGATGDIIHSWTALFEQAYIEEDISFISAIVNDTQPEVTGHDGMMAVAIVKAGNASIKTGQIITL